MLIFWDFLTLSLVVIPFLTGGFWIQRPGFSFELSELSIPVLVVAVVAVLLKWFSNISLENSYIIRFFRELWYFWSDSLEKKRNLTLFLAWIAIGSMWSYVALQKHASFHSHSYDLGIFHNGIWNLAHGNGYFSSVKDALLLSDHPIFISYLIAPLLMIFPNAETLLVLQAFALASTGVVVYFLSVQYLPKRHWGIALIPLLFWNYLPIRNANAFDFHPEVFMVPLFLFGILKTQSVSTHRMGFNRLLGAISILLALACKESSGFIAIGISIAWLLGASPRRVRKFTIVSGTLLLVIAFIFLYFDLRVVPQFFKSSNNFYLSLYSNLGSSIGAIIISPFVHPLVFWSKLFSPVELKFLFWTLAPLGFLPILNWKTFIVAVPAYLMIMLQQDPTRISIGFHYASEVTVGLFWALPRSVLIYERLFASRRHSVRSEASDLSSSPRSFWAMLFLAFWMVGTTGRSEIARVRKNIPDAHAIWLDKEFLPKVNSAVSIAASDALVPHLSARFWIHNPNLLLVPDGKPVRCVIIDENLSNWPMNLADFQTMKNSLETLNFKTIYQCGSLTVYQSSENQDSCLDQPPKCL